MPDQERFALFIDGANLYASAKSLGFDIDYKRLLREFQGRGRLIRAYYYTALVEDQEYSSIRPLVDWLDYNGYSVVTKPTKEFVDSTGRRKVKGNMDIELAVTAMEMAPHMDQMVLFSGDGDFRSLVESLQRQGVRVSVVSTVVTQPPMVADELRRQADEFIDLAQLAPRIGRDPSERAARAGEPRRQAALCAGAGAGADAGGASRRDRARVSGRRLRAMARPIAAGAHACPLTSARPPTAASATGSPLIATPTASPFPHSAMRRWKSFGDPAARLLIVGLAPGLRGANRTGRPFTGDYAGDLLYATLLAFGFAVGVYDRRPDDGLALVDCAIVNAVRCAPPENKPTPAEIAACRPYLAGAVEGAAAPRGDRRARTHRPRQRAARPRRASVALSLQARRATHGRAVAARPVR